MKKTIAIILCLAFNSLSACGGCVPEFECTTGTIGEKERVVFYFEQTIGDLSEDSGNAFSAGTKAHMKVGPYDQEKSLPPYSLESSDEDVISIDEIMDYGDYPVVLGMNGDGSAELRVIEQENNEVYDYATFRVAEPDGLWFHADHPAVSDWDPETILVPVEGARCNLYLYPFETASGERKLLYGEYEVEVSEAGANFLFEESVQFTFLSMEYHLPVAASAPGSSEVTFTGPRNLSVARTLRAVDPAEVDALEIVVFNNSEGMYVNTDGMLTALQRASGEDLCGGFEATFESSDPGVVELREKGLFDDLHQRMFILRAPGTAVVTAALKDNPSIQDSVTITVTERPEE